MMLGAFADGGYEIQSGLSPCPFCGSSNVYVSECEGGHRGRWSAGCLLCDADGPTAPTPDEAREKWNTRVTTSDP